MKAAVQSTSIVKIASLQSHTDAMGPTPPTRGKLQIIQSTPLVIPLTFGTVLALSFFTGLG